MIKTCCQCKQELALTEFYKATREKDGLQRQCKSCHKESQQKYLSNSTARNNMRMLQRNYYKTEKGKKCQKRADQQRKDKESYLEVRERAYVKYNSSAKARATKTANSRKYSLSKENRTPPWFEYDKVRSVYQRCQELNEMWGTTFEVDHIIPLNGENVSGLHCWENLQLLDKTINREKSNILFV